MDGSIDNTSFMGLSLLCLLTSAALRNDSKLLPPKGLLQYSYMYYICMLSKIIYSTLNRLQELQKRIERSSFSFDWHCLLLMFEGFSQPRLGLSRRPCTCPTTCKKTGSLKRCVQLQLGSIWSYIVIYAYVIYKTYNTYEYTHNHTYTL